MKPLHISALITFISGIGICFINEVFAAPFFVLAGVLAFWDVGKAERYTAPRHYESKESIMDEVKIPEAALPQIQQQKTEATEHTMEYPNGSVLTIRKVTKWH